MTGERATHKEILVRIAKALAFVTVVFVPMIIFGPVPVYIAGMWLAAIATTSFPLVYSAVAPWWRYALGRVIFGSVTSTALLVDFTLWVMLKDTSYPWAVWLGSLLWISLAAFIFGLTRQLISAQHAGKSRDLDGTTVED